MGKRLSKKKKPDFSEIALRVVKEATSKTDLSSPTQLKHLTRYQELHSKSQINLDFASLVIEPFNPEFAC